MSPVYDTNRASQVVGLTAGNSTGSASPFHGQEAAGIVRCIGPQVRHLQPGDRVILLGRGTLGTTVTESAQRAVRIPDRLGFNDGAALASAYPLAIYCLKHIAMVERGQVS